MDKRKLLQATKILKDAGCTEIYIFGSQANGKAGKNSDVDLGVKGLPAQSFFGIHYDLEAALNMRVDLVDFDCQNDFFSIIKTSWRVTEDWIKSVAFILAKIKTMPKVFLKNLSD